MGKCLTYADLLLLIDTTQQSYSVFTVALSAVASLLLERHSAK